MSWSGAKSLGLAAAAALALFTAVAAAQDKKPEAAVTKPEKKAAACKTLKSQDSCQARADCDWSAPVKDADGKLKKRAYCHGKPAPNKKAAARKGT